jgi:hypothetical protein
MVTYEQLAAESWYNDETTADAHRAFNVRVRDFWGLSAIEVGSKGDNFHLRGRHRSRNWTRNSIYCTNRDYGDTDIRDKTGDGDWLSASDLGGMPALERYAFTKRLDQAVRAGLLPAVAEWFGTFDGVSVVGWFQGHSSTSDPSHLYHTHIGLWRSMCNDTAQLALLGDIITGGEMELTDIIHLIQKSDVSYSSTTTTVEGILASTNYYVLQTRNQQAIQYAALSAKLDSLTANLGNLSAAIDSLTTAVQNISSETASGPVTLAEGEADKIAHEVRKEIIAEEPTP